MDVDLKPVHFCDFNFNVRFTYPVIPCTHTPEIIDVHSGIYE